MRIWNLSIFRWLRRQLFRYFVRRSVRAKGFLDPFKLMSRLRQFAQPSDVPEPLELLRAGAVFHARGLLNARVIQHNLDWTWPFWVHRQYDPHSRSFLPRAFSITHVNLTHRNWTGIGRPDAETIPIVDPRGLLTPFYDGWSLDAWVIPDDASQAPLLPAIADEVAQNQDLADGLRVVTRSKADGLALESSASVTGTPAQPKCVLDAEANAAGGGWLAFVVRPYNPEGISLIDKVRFRDNGKRWSVNGVPAIACDTEPDRLFASTYEDGDVLHGLPDGAQRESAACSAGMAHAAAIYRLQPNESRRVTLNIDLSRDPSLADKEERAVSAGESGPDWQEIVAGTAQLSVADARIQHLYDVAVRSLILHTPGTVYPGPYTYKRFWFRDAAFILHPLMAMGLCERARRVLATFPDRQHITGYFCSQNGEWDSNGQVLWILDRYLELSGEEAPKEWIAMAVHGAKWICRKRLPMTLEAPHAGLMPAGFSAEHLGPNDYYYWDSFWSIAGLRSVAKRLQGMDGHKTEAERFSLAADEMSAAVDSSLRGAIARLGRKAIPAAPARRMDSGAVGSIVAGYPLHLLAPADERLAGTVEFLMANCFVGGGLFQDMIHSGINAYLTLHVAQQLLRAGDARAAELVQTVADLASPTGQWPEAIHPATGGGCMGDGHHAWASAEWIMMIRNMFVREEGDTLVLLSGLPKAWVPLKGKASYGPTLTKLGKISVAVERQAGKMLVDWSLETDSQPGITIAMPGFQSADSNQAAGSLELVPKPERQA